MRTILIKPEINELSYRKEIYSKRRNTSFLHEPVSFQETDYDLFYHEWIEADPKERLYRYLYCDDCGYSVGEAFYSHDKDKNRYNLMILVEYDAREEGYGTEGLALMEEEGRKHGIDSFWCSVYPENQKAISFLEHHGFAIKNKESDKAIFMKKLS